MKKLISMMACLLFLVMFFFSPAITLKTASASSNTAQVSYNEFTTEVNSILTKFVTFDDRTPGSEGEKKAAYFIKDYLATNTRLQPVSNAHVDDGMQTFSFKSIFSGLYESSQNVIFSYKSTNQTEKKIILACNYDAVAFGLNEETGVYDSMKTEGVNTSAASVSTLLAIAKFLAYQSIDCNIEFIFFGASESSNAGASIYSSGISDKQKENILCMVNLDNVALGKKVYFYSDEIETNFSKFVKDLSSKKKLGLNQVNVARLNKILFEYENELGLDYTHIALENENKLFMKLGITSLNVFAGDYEEGIVIGRSEFADKDVVSYTQNDNLKYITENFNFSSINENLYVVYKSISSILTDADLVSVLTKTQNSTNLFYLVFGNYQLVVYLTVVAFVLFVVIAMFVHYKLSVKAYHANVEVEFLSSVVKISEEIDKTGMDANVPKVVSQVLANDIKKDKVIKSKKVKKDKK